MTTMKAIWTMIGVFVFASSTGAVPTLDEFEFEKIKSAQSNQDLLQVQAQVRQLRIRLRACDIQISENFLPFACYSALKIFQNLGLSDPSRLSKSELDAKCLNIAAKTKEVTIMDEFLLSSDCRQLARKTVNLNRYKSGMYFENLP